MAHCRHVAYVLGMKQLSHISDAARRWRTELQSLMDSGGGKIAEVDVALAWDALSDRDKAELENAMTVQEKTWRDGCIHGWY